METLQSLFEGARRGDIRHTRAMLEAGANVNAKDENGNTALMEAAAWGRAIIVKFLVDSAGGDVNLTNREGFTALIKAAAGGHTDVVRYLTQVFGTDVNATTMFGDSAAALAAQYGHTDLAQYLVVECQAVLDTTKLRAAVDRRDDVARYLAEGGASRVNASNANAIGGEVRRAAQDRRSAPSIDAWSSALAQAAVDGNVYGLRRIVGSSRVNVNVNATVHDGDTALMKAAGFGHFAVVRYLVAECGADVNIANYRGITALMRADTEEHLDIVRYLTRECGADVNATDSGEATILMRVAAKGRLAVVQCLVEDCGARVNAIDWYGETALLKAAGERHLDVVRYLAVKCGADVNTISSRGVTALMEAASKGSIDVVRCLAEECGASVDVVNGSGTSAVMLAAQSGQLHVVRYLAVECRANVNATDKNGDTALLGAALQGHFDTARFLAVNCEADLDVTALTKAAARGCFYAVRFLVEERRVDTSATDISGATVLMTAAQHGHIHIVRYLVVTRKGDVNVADKYGDTPLTKASANGHFDVVRALVREYGADVSTTNNTGTTPLMLAAQHGHVDIVRYLAGEHAVDVNAADISGTNALMIAAQYGHIGVVHYLAGDRGADANATNSTRTTALMIAAQYGNMDVVRHLATQYRANVNAANADGYTAMRFAAERGHEEIQRFLTRFLVVHQAGGPETRTARSVPSDATVNNTPSWFIPPSEISLVSFVETGNIGGEYQAKWLDADAAVKLFVPDASSHVGFEHEVHFWHRLRHPNVIKMYGACDASPLPLQFFVCEYASNGSLLEYTKLIPPEEQRVWTFLHQAALGLEYLHEREIIHGDLRCSNILIGSDGLAKLANFARSNSMHQIRHGATLSRVGSVRWQPPEVLKREALSFASDVYSLGMCILEAVTKGVPWKDIGTDYMVRDCKLRWSPENADEDGKWAPKCLSANARDLVWLMCCQDPKKRASLSSVVHKLERLALRDTSRSFQPEQEPPATYDDYNYPARKEVWMDVQECIQNCDNDLYRLAYMELEKVRECLQKCPHTLTMFQRFHTLVRDFRTIITSSSERARILQLSATRATNSSMTAFRRRLRSLRTALGEADSAVQEREARWEQQHNKQIEIFVSEASKTYLLLEELTSPEERLVFLASLKADGEPTIQIHPSPARFIEGSIQRYRKQAGSG